MRRRSGLSPTPIEFLPRQFYFVVIRERTACSMHRATDKSCDDSAPSERHLFARTPGIQFVSLQEQLLPSSASSEFVLGIPQTIRFNSFLTGIMSTAAASSLIENSIQASTCENTRGHPEKVHYFFLRRRHLREEIQAIHLICRWRLLYLQLPPQEALAPFEHLPYLFSSFVSSSNSFDPPNLMVSLGGISKGLKLELMGPTGVTKSSSALRANWDAIAADSEQEANLWKISQRFIVCGGVFGRNAGIDSRQNGSESRNEEQTAELEGIMAALKRRKVSLVVTLCKVLPDISTYAARGLETLDLSASTTSAASILLGVRPASSDDILVNRFLEACEVTEGLIAVNVSSSSGCVSAATCIGCYLMKHSNFTFQEAIGWLRFCLPVQIPTTWELFLAQMQSHMWLEGERFRRAREGNLPADISNSPTIDSTHINIGKISLGRVSLLGTRDRHRVDRQASSIPVSTCLSSRSQEHQQSPTAATATQLKQRPLTQGSTGSRRYHRSTDGTLRADFALMHKFLHQAPTTTHSTTTHIPSRPKASRPPDTCTEALA